LGGGGRPYPQGMIHRILPLIVASSFAEVPSYSVKALEDHMLKEMSKSPLSSQSLQCESFQLKVNRQIIIRSRKSALDASVTELKRSPFVIRKFTGEEPMILFAEQVPSAATVSELKAKAFTEKQLREACMGAVGRYVAYKQSIELHGYGRGAIKP
jgi:hypothetical protein